MKKFIIFTLIVLLLALISITYYFYHGYTLSPDMIKADLEDRINMGIDIKKYDFDEKYIYVFYLTNDNCIGNAIYEKTIFNTYSFLTYGYKTSFYDLDLFEVDRYKKEYVVSVSGKNLDNKIDYFILYTNCEQIKEHVDSKYFFYKYNLSYHPYLYNGPKQLKVKEYIFNVRFYDKNNNDITSELSKLNRQNR
ncbi:hypothetical protein PV797_03355 [Clostridiaceae bacterium M8S5]|nr:hypothetical protein PV797_03355 [Clostridiaceae bacterium M8S5]